MLMTPGIAKRQEKKIEGGDELEARQSAGASAHLELEKTTRLTAGAAFRRGTRLSSIRVVPERKTDASAAPIRMR